MKLPLFQVDAFAENLFKGNPAAVVPLDQWLDKDLMQQIAMENNLSETAFFITTKDGFEIRWFTPKAEVKLCGHATLATAHVIFEEVNYPHAEITFGSHSGPLIVSKKEQLLQLDFPADRVKPVDAPNLIIKALGKLPVACYKGKTDYMLVYESEIDVRDMNPNFSALAKTDARGIIVTAPGTKANFVSRFFAPRIGVDEDPVTGSAHTTLTPYWANRLGKQELTAHQLSKRGGELIVSMKENRVLIAGKTKTYMRGEIFI
ncbi:PhzF family phenazine biosynthesis protein [Mangrovibacterium lignilyticum]|uniref:PhzF family phenazine biosynthesis protein n=1 Tax=Mangrovibacterium lignilyticum TaxID=2668052 RepID=UPI0013D428B2|nr:PhzF family phenazine biosynthesis protein [Mangrovibacterium lignilyticum]